MTNFTKGEWQADCDVVYVTNGYTIADCDFGGLERLQECNANAHLIAAAPDMYAMLEGLLHDGMDCEEYDKIDNILKKARGE